MKDKRHNQGTNLMKINAIQTLTETFEGHDQQTDGGTEFWLARDLQVLLG